MKRALLLVALILAFAGAAAAQESEYSGGGGTAGAVTGTGSIGRVPQFASATSLADSKMLTSGTNSGTWTLYDDTATSGLTRLNIRQGESNPDQAILFSVQSFGGSSLAEIRLRPASCGTCATLNIPQVQDGGQGYFALSTGQILGMPGLVVTTNSRVWISSENNNFTGLNNGVSLMYDSPGIAKLADATTGFTGIVGASFGAKTTNGALADVRTISESITLNTGGTTTDSTADLLPANSIILSVAARVTTTITTATDWALGDATTALRFAAANATLTAGTTTVGVNHMQGGVATDAAGPVQVAAAKLRITTTGTPGAGVVRVTVTYISLTPPTS